MLRSGRFRQRLLSHSFLHQQVPEVHRVLLPFLNLYRSGQINPYEMVSLYVLIFALFRRPLDFLGGPLKDLPHLRQPSQTAMAKLFAILQAELPSQLKENKILNRIFTSDNLYEGFVRYQWRSIPLSANRALACWAIGRYPLLLREDVPTSEEVLLMQSQGTRCLSLLTDLQLLQNFIEEGRDAWGFLIHDLIHADHFFYDPERAQAQILFSQKLLKIYYQPQIQMMLVNDPIFKKEFSYLMSDMNTVPLHLLKTFKAILLGYFKRQQGLNFSQSLSLNAEALFRELFEHCLQTWPFCKAALSAADRLNTAAYQHPQDSHILHQALSANHSTNS